MKTLFLCTAIFFFISVSDSKLSLSLDKYLKWRDDDSSVPVWIFFTTKEIPRNTDDPLSLGISERAQKRIQKLDKGVIIDHRDYPVNPNFLETLSEVIGQAGEIRQVSRWLNAASALVQKSKLKEISQLPFVSEIELLSTYQKPKPKVEKPHTLSQQRIEQRTANEYGSSFTHLYQASVIPLLEMGYSGEGVTIAVLDTGYFKDHEARRKENNSLLVALRF
jgi:subtilisin family serine protease